MSGSTSSALKERLTEKKKKPNPRAHQESTIHSSPPRSPPPRAIVPAARLHHDPLDLPLRRRGPRRRRNPVRPQLIPVAPTPCPGAASSISTVPLANFSGTASQPSVIPGQFMATAGQLRARKLPIVDIMVLPSSTQYELLKSPCPFSFSPPISSLKPATRPGPAAVAAVLPPPGYLRPHTSCHRRRAVAAGIPPRAEPIRRRR
jgi:hypothetical protein